MITRSEILAIRNIGRPLDSDKHTSIQQSTLDGLCDSTIDLLDAVTLALHHLSGTGTVIDKSVYEARTVLAATQKPAGEWPAGSHVFVHGGAGHPIEITPETLASDETYETIVSPSRDGDIAGFTEGRSRIVCPERNWGRCLRPDTMIGEECPDHPGGHVGKGPPRRAQDDCECKGWPAGGGGSWLAAYGIFARGVFEEWKKGNRRGVHHPKCPVGIYGAEQGGQAMDEKPKARHLDLDNKYAGWMRGLADDELSGLLWLVGEFVARSSPEAHNLDVELYPGDRRRMAALKAIADFKNNPLGLDAVRKYIGGAVRDGQRMTLLRELQALRHMAALPKDDAPRALEVIHERLEKLIGGDAAEYRGLFNLATQDEDATKEDES